MPERYSIGGLAREAGCKVQTIRYYEQVGLMPEPARTSGNQRRYDRRHVARLAFIRHSRQLGFPLEAVRDLLSLADNPRQSCEAADVIARAQLDEVKRRIARLRALQGELERMIEQCRHGEISECRVIEVLSDHSRCLVDDHLVPTG
ncbi:MAG TPA: helix-turn-helix domain-containing protein [Hyphomicrobiaceae bacterium]